MSLYLSRIRINHRRREARWLLGSLQRVHAAVLASFPDPPTGRVDGARVLWRMDRDGPRTWLYVTGPGRPDFSHIVDQAGWPASEQGWETHEYQPLLDRLEAGQRWRFRLAANPTRAIRLSDGEPDTTRRALLSVSSREEWLVKRAERCGFEIATATSENGQDLGPNLTLTSTTVHRFSKRAVDGGTDSGGAVSISRTQYDGVLHVLDPAALTQSLIKGIGPAKSYGCGLLTLARP